MCVCVCVVGGGGGVRERVRYLLEQDWFQCWVKFLPNILQQTWFAKPNSILKTSQEIFVSELQHVEISVLFLRRKYVQADIHTHTHTHTHAQHLLL